MKPENPIPNTPTHHPETLPPGNARGATNDSTGDRTRYQALRLHARGGLGEVHLATDVELDRRVALKRLQPEHQDNPSSRERFLREAAITAKLEHPGIVPIHGLVRDADGQPSYAMRFIEGESLAEAIRRFHGQANSDGAAFQSLALRQLLQRFITVCNAVAYAHSRGIIHRDLKPSNVMLGPFGETLVVDWGLAKEMTSPRGVAEHATNTTAATTDFKSTDTPDQTQMGHALGTPAYMSPEQAAGRWDVLDQRSDVYGLGATLYELLTGQPPFEKDNWPAMQQKIQRGQFARPREVNKSISAALDAICSKAMALEPGNRYERALDLAADLDRWLADEPVSCCPEPITVRLRRWGRRHRTLATSAVLALVLGAGFMAVLSVLLSERNQALGMAKQQETVARERAEANFALAKEAVEKYLGAVTEDEDLKRTDFNKLRKKLLETAIPFFEKIAIQKSDDPEAEAARGTAYSRLGTLHGLTGEEANAIKDFEEVRAIFGRLSDAHPFEQSYRVNLAFSHNNLGILLADRGDQPGAQRAFEQALGIHESLFKRFPNDSMYVRAVAGSHNNLGNLLFGMGKLEEGKTAMRRALRLREYLCTQLPNVASHQRELAMSHSALGEVLTELNEKSDAQAAFQAAIHILERLHAASPTVPVETLRPHATGSQPLLRARQLLRNVYWNLAISLADLARHTQGVAACEEALSLDDGTALTQLQLIRLQCCLRSAIEEDPAWPLLWGWPRW